MPAYSFISLPKSTVEDFESGKINTDELLEKFGSSKHIVLDELFEVIHCTLERFAPENPAVALICEERSILADANGEAFLIDTLTFPDDNGTDCEVCEPVGYKTTEELQTAVEFLHDFEYNDFKKSFMIRDVLQETTFALYDTQSVLDRQDEICDSAYQQLQNLGDFYRQTLAEQNYVVMTITLNDIEDES